MFVNRNVTCYYYIKQSWAPRNQSILISVGQENGQFFSVRSSWLEKDRHMLSGEESCPSRSSDVLSIYNGATSHSPLLATLCGTGSMPYITSSGRDMLLVFRSQAYDAPLNPSLLGSNPGFHLPVRVGFAARSFPCRMTIRSSSGSRGEIASPDVTLAPNTTCRYEFLGRRNQRVWIIFLAFRLQLHPDAANGPQQYQGSDDCLTLKDSGELLWKECGSNINPRLCPSALVAGHNSSDAKPCRWQDEESFVSQTPRLLLEQHLSRGTALDFWRFRLRYEFITVDDFDHIIPASSTMASTINGDFADYNWVIFKLVFKSIFER